MKYWIFVILYTITAALLFHVSVTRAQATTTTNVPATVDDDLLQEIKQITTGENHTCALTKAGRVKCWGFNIGKQLGKPYSLYEAYQPMDVDELTIPVTAIAAGYSHTCALTESGGVKCWGSSGGHGALGNGLTGESHTPVDVSSLTSGGVAISTGGASSCALLTTGGVKCWGDNQAGQLGDGTTISRKTPVNVQGLSSGVKAIVVGESAHTCAILNTGSVKCWGWNYHGKLGDGTGTNRTTPVDVLGLGGEVIAIDLGWGHTCALLSDGSVQCWGSNSSRQLGNEKVLLGSSTPVTVTELSSGVSAIAAGISHTCALLTNGGVRCWGGNREGQLGDGTTTQRQHPVDVSGLQSGVQAISVEYEHNCALLLTGNVKCWGSNLHGELGNGFSTRFAKPVAVVGLPGSVKTVSVHSRHSCAVSNDGEAYCWGENDYGQLGDGTKTSRTTPVPVKSLNDKWNAIAVGSSHTCGLTTTGAVWCWGSNTVAISETTPITVSGLTSNVIALAGGTMHHCALITGGSVKCWGGNSSGQLGDGTTEEREIPVDVSNLTGVTEIAAHELHTCALTNAGAVKCWGWNFRGQLGDGSTTDRLTPVDVVGLDSDVVWITTGPYHSCAILRNGGARCWGSNIHGELGDKTTQSSPTPVAVQVLTSTVRMLAAGDDYTCALLQEGSVQCWGRNYYGELGDGRLGEESVTSVQVVGLTQGITWLAAGDHYLCAVTDNGAVQCWGYGRYGNLGNALPRVPVDVLATKPLTYLYLALVRK